MEIIEVPPEGTVTDCEEEEEEAEFQGDHLG
jgi:hypothetical protein